MRHLVCLTFDFDAMSGFVSRGLTTPTMISRGEFGVVGARRLLSLLDAHGIAATWFIPGVVIRTYPEVCAEIAAAGEMKGKVIATHAQTGAAFAPFCELCKMTMQTFAGAYGAEAGVAALKWIPLGGLYIAGGLKDQASPSR